MAIEVDTFRFTNGTTRSVTHETGKTMFVREEGHLFVQTDATAVAASTVAVYAPGQWLAATKRD